MNISTCTKTLVVQMQVGVQPSSEFHRQHSHTVSLMLQVVGKLKEEYTSWVGHADQKYSKTEVISCLHISILLDLV